MVWGKGDRCFIQHPFQFLHDPYDNHNAPPQSDVQNFDDSPMLSPRWHYYHFFHTIMKEATSYSYCTSPKTVIYPEKGVIKVAYQVTEEEISHCSNDKKYFSRFTLTDLKRAKIDCVSVLRIYSFMKEIRLHVCFVYRLSFLLSWKIIIS